MGRAAEIEDPGSGETIYVTKNRGVCSVVTAAAEARTLAAPDREGLETMIALKTDGGDLTLTVTDGYNADGDTSITYDDAGDYVVFRSIDVGGSYYWRGIAQEGTNAAVEEGTFDTITATTATLTNPTVSGTLALGASAVTTTANGVGAKNGTTVTVVEGGNDIMHKTVLTLDETPVQLTDEAGVVAYGGVKVYDFPAGAILILGATADLSLGINAAGVNSDWDGDFGLGTTTAGNDNTLSTTEDDILPSTATPQAVNNAVANCHGQSTAAENVVFDGTATAKDLYLNILVDDADHDVTNTNTAIEASGTITVHWMNLGDY